MRVPRLVACVLLAQAASASGAPAVPDCGSVDRDIGEGFTLTQRMWGGSRDFELRFQPRAGALHTRGVKLSGPFELILTSFTDKFDVGIGDVSPSNGPHIGLYYYGISRLDGSPYTGTLTLNCGGGTVLRNRFELGPVAGTPINFPTPFFGQPEQRCLRELMKSAHLHFTVAEPAGSPPALAISGSFPLGWAVRRVQTIWAEQIEDAKAGRCRMRPTLPPPGPPPPPPPPPPQPASRRPT